LVSYRHAARAAPTLSPELANFFNEHLAKHDTAIVGMARQMAVKFKLSHDLIDDLAQEARIFLMEVHANGYDHGRGASLMTYAYRTLYWRIYEAAKEQA
jgi:DNA-directed RNA polymerase specialized sigma subunit